MSKRRIFVGIFLSGLCLSLNTNLAFSQTTPDQPNPTTRPAAGRGNGRRPATGPSLAVRVAGDTPTDPGPLATGFTGDLNPTEIVALEKKVGDWELKRAQAALAAEQPNGRITADWTWGATYVGFLAASRLTGDEAYDDQILKVAQHYNWGIGNVRGGASADDTCISQAYLDLYLTHKASDPAMLTAAKAAMDYLIAHPGNPATQRGNFGGPNGRGGATQPANFARGGTTQPAGAGARQGRGNGPATTRAFAGGGGNAAREAWWWCDALFMAPAAWVRMSQVTGDSKYLAYVDTNWWITSKLLYNEQAHLYARDATYIKKTEANGKPMFWSRGEGWVFGGLARTIPFIPASDANRDKYIQQFKEMAQAIAALQQPDGLWSSGMLDPQFYGQPENSGSAFFAYGLAWGVNNGILDRATFEPVIRKAWKGLVSHIYADGRLGDIQTTGAAPAKFVEGSSYNYGVGAFLMAGEEMYKLAGGVAKQ